MSSLYGDWEFQGMGYVVEYQGQEYMICPGKDKPSIYKAIFDHALGVYLLELTDVDVVDVLLEQMSFRGVCGVWNLG